MDILKVKVNNQWVGIPALGGHRVYIKYAASQPTQDSDMKDSPDEWMGIYAGVSATTPEHYTDYTWYKIKGAQGIQGNPFTYSDFTPAQLEGLRGPQGIQGIQGVQGIQGDPGKDFNIAKVFSSISAMESYTGTDIESGDFAIISTVNINDADNGKLYRYEGSSASPEWTYICDLSGPSDLPAVTSSDSGKVLQVSSNGAWEAQDTKANKADTVLDTTLSLGRKANTTVGENSIALGYNVEASGDTAHAEGIRTVAEGTGSHAEGSQTVAHGVYSHAEGVLTVAEAAHSHAEGNSTQAHGRYSHAEGYYTNASGLSSHSEGQRTIASGACSHVSGIYNVEDDFSNWSEWTPNTSYVSGDKVKRTVDSTITGYICKTDNSDSTFTLSNWINTSGRMNYAEIIGNGMDDNNRSNARALDWDGNERLKGNIYVGCNADSTGGTMLTPPVAMTGATSSTAGTAGYVPAPVAGDDEKFLRGDGTWATVAGSSLYRQFWDDTNQIELELDNDGKTYLVWCAASTAGTSGEIGDATYGALIFVSDGKYSIVNKGSGITVTKSSDQLTISSTTNIAMAIVEI